MRAFLAATLALFAFASATPDVDPRSREAGLSLYDSSEPIRLQPRSTSSFKAAVLQVHNSNRRNHGARALVWSDSLARGAGKWASRCRFEHGGLGNNQGQNIAAGTPVVLTAFVDRTGFNSFTKVMQAFMAERKDYNPNNPQASHYTQVVWKGTSHVGCAVRRCNSMAALGGRAGSFYVCNYSSAGNVVGSTLAQTVASFKKNVQN